ncbi:MAG: hypothetical protein A2033_00550 [Bacteroidetes bacterium GWA2_31_9]|nr:MAG: hypothetical protein A2033_00550 [Bacteroidetes bacterium GWA2_31_9]
MKKNKILMMIKNSVKSIDPSAIVILFGSYARGDNKKESDIDLLILLNKDSVSRNDEKQIKYPLYEIEFEIGKIISPIVLTLKDWTSKHKITPFYENVTQEGIIL